ncbi:protein SPT2 homolog [Plodia interpunctella]|uniref:protein SPT2 homolog n=1 Tax=Plodia interpunctella TaxID=58824 RepID=UPI0023682E4B|nr:protein SPT2 homolog [Plodia interpunctella]
MSSIVLTVFLAMFYTIQAIPVVLKGSSPSGNAVVSISSNDPVVVRYFTSNFPAKSVKQETVITRSPGGIESRSFSISAPGQAAAGSGRNFVSASALTAPGQTAASSGRSFVSTSSLSAPSRATTSGRSFVSTSALSAPSQSAAGSGRSFVSTSSLSVPSRATTSGRKFVSTSAVSAPGQAASSSGRSFVSTSAFNPFLTPLFFNPINFEGLGFGNFEPMNLFKGFESFPDARFSGPGTISAVSAVNDNGRVYGNVKTIKYNSRPKTN